MNGDIAHITKYDLIDIRVLSVHTNTTHSIIINSWRSGSICILNNVQNYQYSACHAHLKVRSFLESIYPQFQELLVYRSYLLFLPSFVNQFEPDEILKPFEPRIRKTVTSSSISYSTASSSVSTSFPGIQNRSNQQTWVTVVLDVLFW